MSEMAGRWEGARVRTYRYRGDGDQTQKKGRERLGTTQSGRIRVVCCCCCCFLGGREKVSSGGREAAELSRSGREGGKDDRGPPPTFFSKEASARS